jgi:proteic killer suppression protein
MEIESIRHKPLRAFAETGKVMGLPGNFVDRLGGKSLLFL